MKKIWSTLVVALMPITVAAQTTVVDHETPATTTSFQYFGNCDLDGSFNNIIANPATDAVNGSATVADFVRRSCAATFAGYFSNPQPTQPVDLTTDNRINMKVWAPNTSTITLKLEASPDGGSNWEQTIAITDTMQWVQIQFDAALPSEAAPFTSADGFTYAQPVIFFNLGAAAPASDQTFYWDDLETDFVFTLDQIDLPITFEDPAVDYTLTDFGGNFTSLVPDPTDGTNTVASSFRPDVAEFFAGTTMSTPAGLDNAIPVDNDNTRMSMRVLSPAPGIPVRLKIENAGDPTQSVETEVLTTAGGTWETLIFDFANEVPGTAALNIGFVFNKSSVFFNFGAAMGTAGDATYLWDDVEFIGGGGTGVVANDLPITFDDPAVDYSAIDFGGAVTALVADPVDPANTVTSFFKPSTADFFAGSTMSGAAGLATPIPLTPTENIITVRVWSPMVGTKVKFKVEDNGDPTKSVETDTFTTVANAWETLVFDFNNESPGTAILNPAYTFDKANIFFDFGNDGSVFGDQTYFYDDVYLGFPPVASCSSATPPTNQSHTVLSNRVQLDWDPQALAVACQVKGQRLPTGPSPSVNILSGDISTTNVPFNAAGAGTTWTWQVRCACSISPLDVTAFTAFGDTFNVPTARVASLVDDVTVTNPVSDLMIISANVQSPVSALVQVMDMQGRTVATRRVNVEAGRQSVSMDLSSVANGIYFVNAPELGLESAKQIVVQH